MNDTPPSSITTEGTIADWKRRWSQLKAAVGRDNVDRYPRTGRANRELKTWASLIITVTPWSDDILISVKGHPYERDPFAAVFESFEGIRHTFVEQPASQAFLNPEAAEPWDVLVFYDMPGIDFSTQPPGLIPPPDKPQSRLQRAAVCRQGHGVSPSRHRRLASLA